jgi:hypothetical protein
MSAIGFGSAAGGGSAGEFALIEMIFSFGVVLALAFWQLWDVRPSRTRPKESVKDDKPDH